MNNIFTIIKKEFIDILRDKKTLVMTFVIPIAVMPLLFTFIFSQVSKQMVPSEDNKYNLILSTDSETLKSYFNEVKELVVTYDSGQEAIDKSFSGETLLYVEVQDNFDEVTMSGQIPNIKLYYDTTSQRSQTCLGLVDSIFSAYQNTIISSLLDQNGLPTSVLQPYNYQTIAKDEEVDSVSVMMLGMLIPMMLIGYTASGIIPIACDLGAGEKERGTMEPLLSTSVSRLSILAAKLTVTSIFGIITSVLSTIGIFVSMKYGMPESMAISVNISIGGMMIILLLSILYSVFISAILLLVSTYARSLKEANTYLTPFALVPMLLSMVTMYMDVSSIPSFMLHVPILNVVTIIKEIIVNQLNYSHLYITIGWSVVYIVVILIVARIMYEKEEVMFRS